MTTVRDVLDALERIAPKSYAFDWDAVGLQVGYDDTPVARGVVSLDRSLAAAVHAENIGAQVLVAHHPLIFRPISRVDGRSHIGKTILVLARAEITFIAAHTNWDAAQGGVNDTLAELLGLRDVRGFGSSAEEKRLKLVVFCPAENADAVIDAAANAGAGQIGMYRRCAFSHAGTGTFVAGEDARPSIGKAGCRERVDELRIEMVVPAHQASAVQSALRQSHPYEEPAFDFFQLSKTETMPLGRIGKLEPLSLADFADRIDMTLSTRCWTWGNPHRIIQTVAIIGGAADDEWQLARESGADVLVTGEVRQHFALEAVEEGMAMIGAGHYATENPGAGMLCKRLRAELPTIEWSHFEPPPGEAGRPVA